MGPGEHSVATRTMSSTIREDFPDRRGKVYLLKSSDQKDGSISSLEGGIDSSNIFWTWSKRESDICLMWVFVRMKITTQNPMTPDARRASIRRYRTSEGYRVRRREIYRTKMASDESFRTKENERQRRWVAKRRRQKYEETVEAVRLFCGEEVAAGMKNERGKTEAMEEVLRPEVAAFWEEIGFLVEGEGEWESHFHF